LSTTCNSRSRVDSFYVHDRAVARETGHCQMDFRPPNIFDRTVNHAFGFLLKLGIGLRHNYLLEVHGRKTGRVHSTPVNLIEFKDRKYLVAPRGYTQWVRNVEASSEATLVSSR